MPNRKSTLELPPTKKRRSPPLLEDEDLRDETKAVLNLEDLHRLSEEVDFTSDQEDYGDTRESEARAAGYLDTENKKPHSRDRRDDEGRGTGAYTDVGRGRSAAIKPASSRKPRS